ncbi:indolepyruvate ferredoxin oxidoreductase family protein, partial [Myxococcota bacterium]|nr:indolepyruvate ferredoxin oxidoreductase family protein [Myxococcota bacterium]
RVTGLWAALNIVADVADAKATVDQHTERIVPVLPQWQGRPYLHHADGGLLTPRTLEIEREIIEVRYELARQYARLNRLNRVVVDPPGAWIGLVSSGITYREVREALARLGLESDAQIAACGIRLLKMNMPMPFEPELVRDFAKGLAEVFVLEEKRPGLEALVKEALYPVRERPIVVGRFDEVGRHLVPGHGALDADLLITALRRRLEPRLADRLAPPRRSVGLSAVALPVVRKPFFCSGCPHNRSTEVPKGSLVGAGIGCHTMALLMDKQRVGDIGGLGCMGNEGIQWIGMSPFLERGHFFQNLGDGTYFHSGQLAIAASIAAGVNVTYKLLYNGAVAMTGGQHPEGQLPVAKVAAGLASQGVAGILITTEDVERYAGETLPPGTLVWHRDRLIEAQERLAQIPGTTVLIHDQACAAEARRARKRGRVATPRQRVVINPRLCEGCGDCGRASNCLSVEPVMTPFGRKTQIDQTTCNLDYSCLEGDCPSFMTVTLPAAPAPATTGRTSDAEAAGAPKRTRRAFPTPPESFPPIARLVPDDEFATRITGIGGTGVVTVAQVLGTAAMLDGYHVRGLDQIGLSQKAGPVVSDLRLSKSGPTATNRIGEAQADLLLAFDQLVAASEKGLLTADRERTTVVGSTSATATGDMITHPEIALPEAERLIKRIAEATRSQAGFWADAAAVTEDLFGSTTPANFFVVGMAIQAGCLPIDAAKVEQAIRLNGVSVEPNLAAFRWGRAQIADAEAVLRARREARIAEPSALEVAPSTRRVSAAAARRLEAIIDVSSALGLELARYAAELEAWGGSGGQAIATWLSVLERVAARERAVVAVGEETRDRLLAAVAAALFKLLAYKDEYEVARLMTDAEGTAAARAIAGNRGRIAWRLHPPILRALGLEHKIAIPVWTAPLVRLLARMRFLRGTPFDLFGYAEVRRLERALPGEYVAAIDRILPRLTRANHPAAIVLAELPDRVRGYEAIKLAQIARYREALASAEAAWAE